MSLELRTRRWRVERRRARLAEASACVLGWGAAWLGAWTLVDRAAGLPRSMRAALLASAGLVAAWRVWRRGGWDTHRVTLALFLGQLALNFAWSFIFFGARQIGWALADIVVLWILIAMTMRRFAAIDRLASWLLAPYLAWVTYAAALNAAFYRLQ